MSKENAFEQDLDFLQKHVDALDRLAKHVYGVGLELIESQVGV